MGEERGSRDTRPFRLWWGLAGIAALGSLMLLAGPYGAGIVFAPDQGIAWYFWKRPDPDAWSRASAWTLYALHQLSLWALIYHAQRSQPSYSKSLHRFNALALATNAVFVILHIVQTRVWYDGLAQDTSVFSSQVSVVLLLVLVLIMENQRRGLFFGWSAPMPESVTSAVRRYHGYYFSWAIVYTFWFHPIETNPGHMFGNIYTLLLLLQGSLFFTSIHTNRAWTTALEVLVLVHGAMVAYLSSHSLIGQFVFGFLAIFLITQMHGLNLSRAKRGLITATIIAAMLTWYRGDFGTLLAEVPRVPIVEYLLVYVVIGLVWVLFIAPGRLVRRTRAGGAR